MKITRADLLWKNRIISVVMMLLEKKASNFTKNGKKPQKVSAISVHQGN